MQRCFSNRTGWGRYRATASFFMLCFIDSSGCRMAAAEWWLQSLNELYSHRLAICHRFVSVKAELWATLHPQYMGLLHTLRPSFLSIITAYLSGITRCHTEYLHTEPASIFTFYWCFTGTFFTHQNCIILKVMLTVFFFRKNGKVHKIWSFFE